MNVSTSLYVIVLVILCCRQTVAQAPWATGQMRHEAFVSRIKKDATIYLQAGSVIQLKQEVRLPSGVTITTDKNNPARIIRSENSTFGLCIQGESITIENVILDFAMLKKWRQFRSMIAFKMPSHLNLKPDSPISDVTIKNVTFVDSSPPNTRTTKDSWAIDLAHNSPSSLKNIKILGCMQLAKRIQLTGNGQGVGGIDGLQISHNYVESGYANSIAVSSSTDGAVFQNFLISHNDLRNCLNIGVFVGLDGGKGDKAISLRNVVIAANNIELARKSGSFPHCIYVRAPRECDKLIIASNVLNTLAASSPHSRWLTLLGNKTTPGSYRLIDNVRFGRSSLVVSNMKESSMKTPLPASSLSK